MNKNPFSPSFGIDPDSFFGRVEYLDRFEVALETPGSAELFFMLTGTRGCGKTSLLHQYALRAKAHRWDVIESTNVDALDLLLRYVGLDEETVRGKSLSPTVTIPGAVSVSLGSSGRTTTTSQPISLLSTKLCEKLSSMKRKNGLLIIVDEAQKIERKDIVRIGNAVQSAKSQGLPIALVLGGLPNMYNKIRGYTDCSFLKRMKRVNLWCMTKAESLSCLKSMFAKIPQIVLTEEQMGGIWRFVGGHPYLLQLVGDGIYQRVLREIAPTDAMIVKVDAKLIEDAQRQALALYQENVLSDLFPGVHPETRRYIETAFLVRDQSGKVETSKINQRYGKTSKEMASVRSYAINTQVVRAAERGCLRFTLPHYEYIFEYLEYDKPDAFEDDWEY